MDGILNICKPVGMSSNTCMSIVKRKLGLQKVGFLGTLDPAACGVLVLLCGKYTKWAEYLHGRAPHPNGKTDATVDNTKIYRSIFTFGIETDTLDSEGTVTNKTDKIPTKDEIEKILPQLTGQVEITVPKFSAAHINGKRGYELARAGVDFTPPVKTVEIKRFELLQQIDETHYFFEIECETGTYVRSLAKLVATRLNTFAIASLIIRMRVGDFDIQNSKSLQNVTADDIILI